MKIIQTAVPDVLLIEPEVFGDERGFFMETFRQSWLQDVGIDASFVQDNHSASRRGVLRGLHYQLNKPQGKLLRVISGEVFDVAVDLREQSPSFGNTVCASLSAENKRILWVPPGFAHGFLVLSEKAEFVYKCTDYYQPQDEHSLLWNDPALAIGWPLDKTGEPMLSEKDQQGLPLASAPRYSGH
jgi:dTDP-4-dehydrorhamnose 3,5-epimerase